ncbi:helix-turn-helix transcriptional regulator [Fodinicola acaciae]|uniref:helix-turn-helix transcriptional regulator n=1 Tax=Fodinicola acaciae TaxID=2681555 RepID=UPI0013CFE8DA|nr:YafY family protein [Fodinicola acaciae]
MRDTSARLLRLLSLLQSRRDWSGADLAARLAVDVRTVRRDVDKLRGLGYPVHASPGVAGGYRLGSGAALPPLLLEDDEAVAVVLGLRIAANGTITGLEETSVRALAKLEQVLPARLRQRVNALQDVVVPIPNLAPAANAEVLTAIASACRDKQRLVLDYAPKDRPASQRTVEPYRLVHTGRRWYLVAFDLARDDWRTFRIDRVTGVAARDGRFTPRDMPEEPGTYVSRSVSTRPYRYQAKVLLHASLPAMRELIPPTVGLLEDVDEHSCHLYAGSDWPTFVAAHLTNLDVDFEVLEPPELVERIRAMVDRLSHAVGDRPLP